MARRLYDWLTSHLEYTDGEEGAEALFFWTGLSCISTALQRKVWLDWTAKGTLKPNLYVMLVGHSGVRKGEGIGLVKKYLAQAGIETLADASTWESLSADLKDHDSYYMYKGKLYWQHGGTIIAEEVINLIGTDNLDAFGRFIELHNAEDRYRRSTKTSGKDDVEFPFLGMLGGATPSSIRQMFPQLARGGGFISRIVFIYLVGKRQTIADPGGIIRDPKLYKDLVEDLQAIHRLSGPMKRDTKAKEKYETWYLEQDEMIQKGTHPLMRQTRDVEGWLNRRAETSLKLAMCLAASKGDHMIIDQDDMKLAIDLVTEVDGYIPSVFPPVGGLGKDGVTRTVIETIRANGTPITEATLLADLYGDVSHKDLGTLLETLKRAKLIKVERGKDMGRVYSWIGEEDRPH